MPKYRQLHVKILESFDFNELPDDFTRLFWIQLMLIVDSQGRGIDNPGWIRSKMFPLRPYVREDTIQGAMESLAGEEMIKRYTVDGRQYFRIVNFHQYQSGTKKEAPSNLPADPDELQSNSGATPEQLLPAASASESESIKKNGNGIPGGTHYLRIFSKVTGMVGIPGNSPNAYDAIDNLLNQHKTEDATAEFLVPYWEAWNRLKRKDGQPVSKTNLAWLTEFAIAGQLPGENAPKQSKAKRTYE